MGDGGYTLGELAGVLRLDDSQMREALGNSSEAITLLRARLDEVQGDVDKLRSRLGYVGFDLGEVNKLFAQFAKVTGGDSKEAVNMMVDSLQRMQSAIRAINSEGIRSVGGLSAADRATAARGRGETTVPFADQLAQLRQISALGEKELQDYRAKLEAQRLQTEALKEEYRVKQDYAGLVSRLRAQEQADANTKRSGDNEGTRQERDYAARRAAEQQAQDRNYAGLKAQLQKESDDATIAARNRIDADARKRQQEIIAQTQGDAAARLRLEQETAAEQSRIQAQAQARERAQFIEHRRQMQLASAATTVGVTAAAVGGAGLAGSLFAAKDAAQFQDAMAKSLAVVGDLGDQMKNRLSQAARDAAKETGLAAKDIAADFAIAAKGGLDAAEALKLIPQAARFAIATNSELHESTRQVITIMESMRLQTSQSGKVMDELTLANQLARGSVDQLATTLEGKAGAALRSAHVSLEEALALTVAFSRSGVTAAQAQTFLTQVVERLTTSARKYGEELVFVGDKQMKFHDIVYTADGSVRPFVETLKLLDSAFQGKSANQIGKFFDDIHLGAARGAQALKILLSQSDTLDLLTKAFGGVGNAVQKAFDQQMQSPLAQLAKLKANLTDVSITLGIPMVAALQSVAGAAKPLLETVQSLAAEFQQLPTWMQTTAAASVGLGSALLVAGGGALVLLGHIIRLKADLQLLMAQDALGGMAGTLTGVVGQLGTIAAVIAAITAAVVAFGLEMKRIREDQERNGPRKDGLNLGGKDTFYGFGYSPDSQSGPQSESIKAHHKIADDAKSAGDKLLDKIGKAETAQTTDTIRQALEEFRKNMKDVLEGGQLSINPEEVLRKALKIEDIRQKFMEFSDQFNQVFDKLTAEEQSYLQKKALGIGQLFAGGADPRVILSQVRDLDADLKRYRSDAAERERQERITYAKENAASAVKAFVERTESDLKSYSPAVAASVKVITDNLQRLIADGIDPRAILASLKEAEGIYKLFSDAAANVAKTQKTLDETLAKWDALEKRRTKEKPDIAPVDTRVAPQIVEGMRAAHDLTVEGTKVQDAFKLLGITSEYALKLTADKARIATSELRSLPLTIDEQRAATLRLQEAEIRAEEGLKPLAAEFVKLRMELAQLKADGNLSDRIIDMTNLQLKTHLLRIEAEGLGAVYRTFTGSITSGLNSVSRALGESIVNVDKFGQIWKDTLKSISSGIITELLGSLLRLAAAKIIIALGLKLDSPQVVATTSNTTMLEANNALTKENSDETLLNTEATDNNTAALTALTEAIRNLQLSSGSGGGAAGFFQGIVGGFFGGIGQSAGGALGGASRSFDSGGFVPRDMNARIHANEYVMTPKITSGFVNLMERGALAGGNGDYFDFRGANLGGLSTAMVKDMFRQGVGQLRRNGLRTPKGRF